tara:strand:- start:5964 stop:8657 length:2694 start_codon:yes stop_codon:yes gene_type:complete
MKNIICPLFLLLFLLNIVYADIASPVPFNIIQPNGIELEIFIRGNHLRNWYEYNGWTILKNTEGWWVYARGKSNHQLLESNQKAGIDLEPPINPHLSGVIKKLIPDPIIIDDNSPIPDLNMIRSDTFRVPMILVKFYDYPAHYLPEKFDSLMNYEGYSHLQYNNSGSFRDFYKEISYNQFIPSIDINGWFVAENAHDYYGHSNGYYRVRQLVRDMVDSLEASGFDWSIYDNDGDGYVDALNLAHAGPGAEEGDDTNIWSHKSSLGNLAVSYDGVTINSYNFNPETQMGNFVCIGVFAHEFGHALGLPDLYDTDYSSTGAGKLALMGSGSWGTNGTTPWYPSTMIGWCKNELGWVNIIEISNSQNNVEVEQSYDSDIIYKIQHPVENDEFWFIENRQKISFDILMPQPGLTIWHIKESIADGWSPNNNEPYYGIALEQADGLFSLENGGSSNGGDVFPGTTNNYNFTNNSIPNTNSLYGNPSMIKIQNISEPGIIMSFEIEYNPIIPATINILDGSGIVNDFGTIPVHIDNNIVIEHLSFQLDFYNSSPIIITDIIPGDRTYFDSISIVDNKIIFINPIIDIGSEHAFDIQLFNGSGVSDIVDISINQISAFSTDSIEIAMIVTGECNYQIIEEEQYFSVIDGFGFTGGSARYGIQLESSIPLKMIVIEILNTNNCLIPSGEPFIDANNNGEWDENEEFTDLDNNEIYTPLIDLHPDLETWMISTEVDSSTITVAIANWIQQMEPGSRILFEINNIVSANIESNQTISINTNIKALMDGWGNIGVPYQVENGIVSITESLSAKDIIFKPKKYKLNKIYPNPFNPIAYFEFSVPRDLEYLIRISIYDLSGKMIEVISNQKFTSGKHNLEWDASNISSGIYFAEFSVGNEREIRKLTLLK